MFNDLVMGLCNAGDLFESALCDLLSGLPGVTNIADDILVYGSTQEEHDANVIHFLECCLEIDLHLNPDKVKINCKSVLFFGMILTESGIKPDPKKVEAIHNWPTPTNMGELSFLGSVNYLSQFIPELSRLRKPLQALIKKDSEFIWTVKHNRSFAEVKLAVSKDCLIQFYDPQKPLYVECDASKQGIGCVLLKPDENIPSTLQDGIPTNLRPVAYASKSLSEAEQNYANIECELLGAVFAIETFKHFTYSRLTNIITDHKPLTSLFTKCLANTSPRLSHMLLCICDYNSNVLYQKGSKMYLSDALSRLSSHNTKQGKQTEIKGINISVHDVETDVKDSTLNKIHTNTKADPTLSLVMRYVLDGWPGATNECAENAHGLFYLQGGVDYHRWTVGKETLHASHLGMNKTLMQVRTSVFWPGMTADITALISNCPACQKFQSKQPPETLRNKLPTTQPWTSLATDIFEHNGKSDLIVVDCYSKFTVVHKVTDHGAEQTIAKFLEIFSEFGVPDELCSDRGTNYTSSLFSAFCKGLEY